MNDQAPDLDPRDPHAVLAHWLRTTALTERSREDYDAEVRDWLGYIGENVWHAEPLDVATWSTRLPSQDERPAHERRTAKLRTRARRVSSVRGFYTHAQALRPTADLRNPALLQLRPDLRGLPPGRPPLDAATTSLMVSALDRYQGGANRYQGGTAARDRALGYLLLGLDRVRGHQVVTLDLEDLVQEQHRVTARITRRNGGRRTVEVPPAVVLAVKEYLPQRIARPPYSTATTGPLLTSRTGRRLDGHTTPTNVLRAVAATHPLLAPTAKTAITSDALAATPSPWPLATAGPDDQQVAGTPARLVLFEHHRTGWEEAGQLAELPTAAPHTRAQLRRLLADAPDTIAEAVLETWFDLGHPVPGSRPFERDPDLQDEHDQLLDAHQVAVLDAAGTVLARADRDRNVLFTPFDAPQPHPLTSSN